MDQLFLVLVGALVVAAIAVGVAALITGSDPGLVEPEPDGRAVPLPLARPLVEQDISAVRFDTALRGYRMAQVDAALRRIAYDIGYKQELIAVLEAELEALRDGRFEEADVLRQARAAALSGDSGPAGAPVEKDTGAGEADEPPAGEAIPDDAWSEDGGFVGDKKFADGRRVALEKAFADRDIPERQVAVLAERANDHAERANDHEAAGRSSVGGGPRLSKNRGSTA